MITMHNNYNSLKDYVSTLSTEENQEKSVTMHNDYNSFSEYLNIDVPGIDNRDNTPAK